MRVTQKLLNYSVSRSDLRKHLKINLKNFAAKCDLVQFDSICSLGQASDDMCEPTARSRRQAHLQGGFLRVRCVARGLGIALRNSLATLRQATMFVDS